MKRAVWLLVLASSTANADRYYIDPTDGGGTGVPTVALVLGIVGAVLFSWLARERHATVTHYLGTAFVGFWIGVLLGLPVACAFR